MAGLMMRERPPQGPLFLFDDTVAYPAQWDALSRGRHAHLERPPCAVVPVRQQGRAAPHGSCMYLGP